ncbi:MAG: hypothetical protein IKT47_01160 [Oscillospiraceae bacterium]|nr:hypothetical protein [Oscillospiraceae bacterium]
MKKTLALILAVLMVVALFAGCGKDNTPAAPTPGASTDAPEAGGDQGATTDTPAEPEAPVEEDSPYNFAVGKFAADANGIATEKYNYPLPLTTTDEVLSFWTCCYTPFYIDVEYAESSFPVVMEEMTGVNIEYLMVSAENRSTNFSVLLAADDLPDIMSQANSFYNGVFREGITQDEWFANIYDYRDYCPNYFYEVTKDADDIGLHNSVFLEEDVVGAFLCLRDKAYKQNTIFVRSDWLDKIGWTRDDIVTWQDTHDLFVAFKSQIETAIYPCILYTNIESAGTHWNMYDTVALVNAYGPQIYVDENKQVYMAHTNYRDEMLMTDIAQWFKEGLFDPDWQSTPDTTVETFRPKWEGDRYGYMVLATSDCSTERGVLDDPDAKWLALRDPVLYEGQTLHLGDERSRVYYGSGSVSAKCNNIPLAMTWLDWRYSEEGADYMSWGVEGVAWEYNEAGERQVVELLYNHPAGQNYTMMLLIYCLNTICDPGLDINTAHYNYPGGELVIEAYNYLDDRSNYDGAYELPSGMSYTAEQLGEIATYSSDVMTYMQENFLAFVDGSKPMSEWAAYEAGFEKIGLPNLLAVYQEAYDDYMAK